MSLTSRVIILIMVMTVACCNILNSLHSHSENWRRSKTVITDSVGGEREKALVALKQYLACEIFLCVCLSKASNRLQGRV